LPQPITILVGTMTGTAELVAQEVSFALESAGYQPEIRMMADADASVFDPSGVFLIVTSTYGNGDVPDNAQSFLAGLQDNRPNLSGVIYGLIALGDMTYKATFCHGGLQFDRVLTELGARRLGEPLRHDASSGELAEDVGAQWATAWAENYLTSVLAA
jgi:MioC protein